MRAKNWVLGCAATTAVIMACVGAGCGGDDSTATAADAGVDVTADHTAPTPDASPDTAPQDSAPMCATDADITMISFDAGDAGACLACVKAACTTEIAACNMNCDCKSAFVDFSNCTAMGGSLISCAGSLGSVAQMFTCAFPCASTCGVSIPDGGGDAAHDGSHDGASDAPTDAPADGG